MSYPLAGTPQCRKRAVSRCKLKESLNSARRSPNFLVALWKTPHISRLLMGKKSTNLQAKFTDPVFSNRLLTSGWWAYSRKPNYVADWIMSLTWGAIIGTCTIIPYFYSVFFITVLVHRCTRDFER